MIFVMGFDKVKTLEVVDLIISKKYKEACIREHRRDIYDSNYKNYFDGMREVMLNMSGYDGKVNMMISYSSLRRISKPICHLYNNVNVWVDSGAYTWLRNDKVFSIEDYVKCIMHHKPYRWFTFDYMCEPEILAKTGLTVREHQEKTTSNTLDILYRVSGKDVEKTFSPVIQGYEYKDYQKHARELWDNKIIRDGMVVGVGTLCRRNSERDIATILCRLHDTYPGVKLHAFGVKTTVLRYKEVSNSIYSADSLAWNYAGIAFGGRVPMSSNCILRKNKVCSRFGCDGCSLFLPIWLSNMYRRYCNDDICIPVSLEYWIQL